MRPFLMLFTGCCLIASAQLQADVLTLTPAALEPGQCLVREWLAGGRPDRFPVRVCRRTPAQVKALNKTPGAIDPLLLQAMTRHAQSWGDSRLPSQMLAMRQRLDGTPGRSWRRDYFVAFDLAPYIGCQLQSGDYAQHAAPFRNPCHGHRFDSNGRPVAGEGLPFPSLFLDLPPHRWRGETLVIGEMPADVPWVAYDFRPMDQDESPVRQAFNAVRWGDVARLEALAQEGSLDVNAVSDDKPPVALLVLAVNQRQRAVVRWLLDHGANQNIATPGGTPLLEMARILGEKQVVEWLEAGSGITKATGVPE